MKLILAALSALILSLGFQAVSMAQEIPIAGGYGERSVTDPAVLYAARFAVREESRREGRRISLLAIKRAESQVVAGLNYRLRLSVRHGGEVQEVRAVVYQNLQRAYRLSSWERAGYEDSGGGGSSREVKIYLVALDDRGRRGRKIGCDDSLVPVTRAVQARGTPLRAAIEELLAVPHEAGDGLSNYWQGENLRVRSVALLGGVATIRISGTLAVAGICDEPRIEEQIKATARQFRSVRRVRVFVNGQPLSEAIR